MNENTELRLIVWPRWGGGGGLLPYMGYIGMCGAKGYGFSAVLVINRVSILAILPPLGYRFLHSSPEFVFFRRSYFRS